MSCRCAHHLQPAFAEILSVQNLSSAALVTAFVTVLATALVLVLVTKLVTVTTLL